jgi:hypothetical protein
MKTTAAFRQTLAKATKSDGIPNLDLDTGDQVYPGTYSLEDYTYADLLHAMASSPGNPIPFGVKRDLLAYFADPSKAKYLARKPLKLADLNRDLPILQTISTEAQYPDTAFLPEPQEDKPGATNSQP